MSIAESQRLVVGKGSGGGVQELHTLPILKPSELSILNVASKLPVLGFWQGLWVAFPDYFLRGNDKFNSKTLLLNTKPKWDSISNYRVQRYASRIKSLLDSHYLVTLKSNLGSENVHLHDSIFKVTDKAWRAVGERELQSRINYNPRPASAYHDLLVSAVLLTFLYERGFQLSRPMRWKKTSFDENSPLPDGVVELPCGEIWAIEIERNVSYHHLEGHIIYHGKNSKVIVIFEKLTRPILDMTLYLMQKYDLKDWLFSSCKCFFGDGGRGPYFDLNGRGHYFTDIGEMVDKHG